MRTEMPWRDGKGRTMKNSDGSTLMVMATCHLCGAPPDIEGTSQNGPTLLCYACAERVTGKPQAWIEEQEKKGRQAEARRREWRDYRDGKLKEPPGPL